MSKVQDAYFHFSNSHQLPVLQSMTLDNTRSILAIYFHLFYNTDHYSITVPMKRTNVKPKNVIWIKIRGELTRKLSQNVTNEDVSNYSRLGTILLLELITRKYY